MWKRYLGYHRRCTRLQFWARAALSLPLLVLITVMKEVMRDYHISGLIPGALYGVVAWSWLGLFGGALVGRLHDRDKSGWWGWLALIPILGWIWLGVECGCLPGTPGPNRYGPPPSGSFVPITPSPPSGAPAPAPAPASASAQTANPTHAATVSAGLSLPSPMSAEEVVRKYDMLVKYSEKARAAELTARSLPEPLRARFMIEAANDPSRVTEIVEQILAEHRKQEQPFDDPHLNELYSELASHGSDAQAKFKQVVEFLGEAANPEQVSDQIKKEAQEQEAATYGPSTTKAASANSNTFAIALLVSLVALMLLLLWLLGRDVWSGFLFGFLAS